MIKVDESIAEAAVLGGSFYGGGGGGDLHTGLKYAKLAIELGDVIIVSVDDMLKKGEESYIVTSSIIGAPSALEKHVSPSHIIRSVELLMEVMNIPIGGFITSENGGLSTVNGWIPAAVFDIPIIDAPADGRAHPTGVMGSMGLHNIEDYVSIQTAVGGNKELNKYVEVIARGSIKTVDKIIREASVQAGGMVAVARNPLTPEFIKKNAAVNALSKAIEIGKAIQENRGNSEKICEEVVKLSGGRIVDRGVVEHVFLESKGGYDIGRVLINGISDKYELTFWNEYMTLESFKNKRLATFPDLIVTLNVGTGLPTSTAEIRKDDEVFIIIVPKEKILLGAGVKDVQVLAEVEKIINKDILSFYK
ncbi:MAG: DUF917 family protein [Nitrososphaeria archaeon]|nr:DUF917 family protein [Nitrososphaeria archaeon]MDW7986236.1 DUF917 family protein [Nitrososphaerota archaeon]